MHRRGRGITVLSKIFVSQDRNEKLRKRTLLFSGNFLVSKKIYGWEGAYHVFHSKFLCLTVPKTFVKESYFLRKFLVSKKFYGWTGGDHVFPWKSFGLTVPKIFEGISWMFQKIGVSKNFMHNRGYHNFPSRFFLSHSAEKLPIVTL